MSGQVFEYFFEPAELEPFYSELAMSQGSGTARVADENRGVAPLSPSASDRNVVYAAASSPPDLQKTLEEAPAKASSNCVAGDAADRNVCGFETATASDREPEVDPVRQTRVAPPTSGAGRTRVRQLLSVHALGQYVFCPRSAILAIERGDERDVDEPFPRLSYLPNFDRERIEELLKRRLGELGMAIVGTASMFCLIVAGMLSQNKALFYPAMLVLIACLMWFLSLSVAILQLAMRRQAAIRAEAREPDLQVSEIQKVNWWSMLKAGFESVNYQRPIQHPELPLEGCPWRVLERDSQRIPVIRSGADKLGNRKGELFPKHQIRLVAYSLLLEAAGHEVPYGLVFPRDSARGLAMPITDQLRAETSRTLADFARKLHDSQDREIELRPPENRNRCGHCPHGRPEPIRPGEIENARKTGNRIVVLLNGSDKTYHCECGDRFGSAPPHSAAIRLGLRAALQ